MFAIFALIGAQEWTRVGRLHGPARVAFIVVIAGSLAGAFMASGSELFERAVLIAGFAFWIAALGWVLGYQRGQSPRVLDAMALRFVTGWLVLVPCWVALVRLHDERPALVMFLLLLIWGADSAAYFAGRRFGRRKLASRVSPGKSWEGVLGGLAAVALLALASALLEGADMPWLALFVALSLFVAAASVLGDLAESLFKRLADLKDSGTLIPGHGGVLDRIDSLTAAAPIFALGWLIGPFDHSSMPL